jgi:hypothetical protein
MAPGDVWWLSGVVLLLPGVEVFVLVGKVGGGAGWGVWWPCRVVVDGLLPESGVSAGSVLGAFN